MVIIPPGRVYTYHEPGPSHSHRYTLDRLQRILLAHAWPQDPRALDYGCGNGWFAGRLASMGFNTVGVDISESGIALAKQTISNAYFTSDISADNLQRLGPFDLITYVEVLAHCYTPLRDLGAMLACLKPSGMLLLSTPYHGYFKYLAMAAAGKLEGHLNTSWSGAYVHFFTPNSISSLLLQAGFQDINVIRAGRIGVLAKSMILTCTKPFE